MSRASSTFLQASDVDLPAAQFHAISDLVRDIAGIQLREGKEGLVRSRLAKRLRALQLPSYEAYLAHVREDARELAEMVDLLTTNKTNFFRERSHFDLLSETLLPAVARVPRAPYRVWSAGCSSGEEPYTLAMVVREALPDAAERDVRILATDISHRVLAQAKAGTYADTNASDIPADLLRKYWTRATSPGATSPAPLAAPGWTAGAPLRSLITFASLNLMGPWPMKGPFQAIFCRNVMIYFDKPTQQRLVQRYWELLAPGGHLFVGHSESLSALTHAFQYVQPAVYRK